MTTCTLNTENDLPLHAAAVEPPDARGLNRRGIARLKSGYIAGALADFYAAAAHKPDYPELWNNAGLVRQMLGQLARAVANFDRALAVRSDYAEALTNRDRARQAQGEVVGARAEPLGLNLCRARRDTPRHGRERRDRRLRKHLLRCQQWHQHRDERPLLARAANNQCKGTFQVPQRRRLDGPVCGAVSRGSQ
jgi:tetratricopeptide (TPR) repeat protein